MRSLPRATWCARIPGTLPTLLLVLLGAFTKSKSAQFPFHFWLPQAMSAPTPASAYLHSATMVKAGVFLLVRFWPVLGGTDEWSWIVGGVRGLVTLILGAYAAMFEQDLKGVLAYSTIIARLGLITMLVGLGSALGVVAAIFHIVDTRRFSSPRCSWPPVRSTTRPARATCASSVACTA
ncbi:proton-conducting transporter transmembrane domain-containing protein [Rhodanobacter lindaniclasticus]